MVSRVNLRGCHCLHPPCLDWLLRGFEFLALLFFAGRFVTRICWEIVRTSSLSITYLFVRLNKSFIEAGDFLARDSKNGVPGLMLSLKI